MPEYSDLDLPTLLELLSKHTSQYTRFLCKGVFSGEEFSQCKHTLAEIHHELKSRSMEKDNTAEGVFPGYDARRKF